MIRDLDADEETVVAVNKDLDTIKEALKSEEKVSCEERGACNE